MPLCFFHGDSVQSRSLRSRSAHTNVPSHSTHVTQVTCVKANVVFFDRKPGNWTARTKTLRIYSAVAYSAIIQLIDGIHKLLRLIPPEAVL